MPRTARALLDRIADKLILNPKTGCREWTGRTEKGYGTIWAKRDGKPTTLFVHRAVYEETTGVRLPRDIQVCHKCDNRKCGEFDHFFLGTNADNHKDKALKGRAAKGSKNGNSRLDEVDIHTIRHLLAEGLSHSKIEQITGVDATTVSQIRRGKTWTHV